jgi:RNA polymerase sigma-70 factor, ECF subfamily
MADLPALDAETYAHLRAIAGRVRARSGPREATLQPTGLLHEAWMKVSQSSSQYKSREHFMAVATQAMRQILVDHARARLSQKRGGDWARVTLTGLGSGTDTLIDVMGLHAALTKLTQVDPVAATVAQMRTFGGMTVPEVALGLDTSESTVARKWRFARAFLMGQMTA